MITRRLWIGADPDHRSATATATGTRVTPGILVTHVPAARPTAATAGRDAIGTDRVHDRGRPRVPHRPRLLARHLLVMAAPAPPMTVAPIIAIVKPHAV